METIHSFLCFWVFYLCISSLFYLFLIWIHIYCLHQDPQEIQSHHFVCSLCRNLRKSILHGVQNPVIFLALIFTSTNRVNRYEGRNYNRAFSSSLPLSAVWSQGCLLNSLDSCHLSFFSVKWGSWTIFPGSFKVIDFKGLHSISAMSSSLNPPECLV